MTVAVTSGSKWASVNVTVNESSNLDAPASPECAVSVNSSGSRFLSCTGFMTVIVTLSLSSVASMVTGLDSVLVPPSTMVKLQSGSGLSRFSVNIAEPFSWGGDASREMVTAVPSLGFWFAGANANLYSCS